MTIQAIFEHGVFRPLSKVTLPEGERVELRIGVLDKADPDPVLEKMKSAKTLEELFAIAASLPPDPDDDYDILAALAANRRWSAGHPVDPG